MSLKEQLEQVGTFAEARGGGGPGQPGGTERVASLLHEPSAAAALDREDVRAASAAAFDKLCLVSQVSDTVRVHHHAQLTPCTLVVDRQVHRARW